jgi:heterodisulfide reductase subunit C
MNNDIVSQAHVPDYDEIEEIKDKVSACIQCGTCTGSCGSSYAMDITPRRLWRLVQLGEKEEIFNSKTFYLCSACYFCTLRCPRGLPLTEVMAQLKRIAQKEGMNRFRESSLFYKSFMDTLKRYGRIREVEFINRYFISMKNPTIPIGYISIGIRLMKRGKMHFEVPRLFGKGRFDDLFKRVEEVEGRS